METKFEIKLKMYYHQLLRWLNITKPIQLTDAERKLIKLCKWHYKDKYPSTGNWITTIKPLFVEIYGWDPDENNNYQDYLRCIFGKLLEIHLKIQLDQSGSNQQLKDIFNASFYKSVFEQNELPMERAICRLCSTITNNLVIKNGVKRYEL